VVHMGEKRNAYRFLVRNLKEGHHFRDPGVHGLDFYEHSNESFPFIKSGKFLD